jgi:hypothetical protein
VIAAVAVNVTKQAVLGRAAHDTARDGRGRPRVS